MNGSANTLSGPSGLVGAKTEAPKGWLKLTDSEKIERIHQIVKETQFALNRVWELENKIQKLRTLLTQHSHSDVGVVTKLSEYDNLGSGLDKLSSTGRGPQNPEDVYF